MHSTKHIITMHICITGNNKNVTRNKGLTWQHRQRTFLVLNAFTDKRQTPELGGLMTLILYYLRPRTSQNVPSSTEEKARKMTGTTGWPWCFYSVFRGTMCFMQHYNCKSCLKIIPMFSVWTSHPHVLFNFPAFSSLYDIPQITVN